MGEQYTFFEPRNYKPIAQGNSLPTDATRPSFLSLLPEIRNAVYALLFHEPQGIRIMPTRYGIQDMFEERTQPERLAKYLPLLISCRQVYHEGISTLMSGNTWIISNSFAHAMLIQCEGAARWLQELGTLASMVKKIVIDLDKTCPMDCPTYPPDPPYPLLGSIEIYAGVESAMLTMDFLAQIRHHTDLKVEFVHPKTDAHCSFHWQLEASQRETGIEPDILTTAFSTLLQDPLGIRKYGRQRCEVYLQRNGREGCVQFGGYNPDRRCIFPFMFQRRFLIIDAGKTFAWIEEDSKASFLKLPPRLPSWILRTADRHWLLDNGGDESSYKVITWNLNEKKMDRPLPLGAAIYQSLRLEHEENFWNYSSHSLRLSFASASVNSSHFLSLKEFWDVHCQHLHPWYMIRDSPLALRLY